MAIADNLKVAQQLLATMQQITMQADQQTRAYQAQADLVDALCKAQECYNNLDKNKSRELADSMSQAGEKTKSFSESISEAAEKGDVLANKIKGITDKLKKLAVPAEFLNGFKAGLNFSNNLVKSLFRLAGPVMGLMKDLGGILLSLPGRLMDFFQNSATGGVDPYREALEELRGEFGNLEIGTSAAIRNMTESMNGLGDSGLKMGQVFGYGREGLAALLRENMKVAQEMGPIFDQFSASLRGAETDFTVLRKATNLSGEAFKGLFLSAQDAGMSSAQMVKELTKDVARAERAFGISAKLYGKDMEYMIKETASFGIMGRKEMLSVSTYARKLGVSLEALKAVMDKTLNFEDVAQSSAKLSEAFGIQIDSMKLLNAQTATEKMEIYRKAFFATGQNIEQMTNAQRKLLSEQTGLDEQNLRIAFAQKNRALSGAQLDAQMKKQQKTQISQAEAMQQLAKSIQRLVKSGEALKGGFIEIFMKGFFSGIKRTREFREVVMALQRSMRIVYYAGREVGRMFVKLFPGIKDILGGLKDMFNPSRFRNLMKNVVREFRDFFLLLKTDPKAGVENFMKNMKKIFFDFFSKGTPAGSKFLDGLKTFFKTIGIIFVQGIKYSLGAMKDLLKGIVEFIKNPSSLTSAAGEVGDGLAGMFKQAFAYMVVELGPVIKELGKVFVELMKTLYEKYIQPHMTKIILGGLAIFLGPAMVAGLVRGLIAGLFSGAGIGAISKGFTKLSSTISSLFGGKDKDGKDKDKDDPKDTEKKGKSVTESLMNVAKTVTMFTVAVSIVLAAIIALSVLYESANIKPESLLVMIAAFAAISLLFVGIAKAKLFESLKTIGENLKGEAIKNVGKGLLAMGGLLVVVGGLAAIGAIVFKHITKESVDNFLYAVAGTSLLLVAMAGLAVVAAILGAAATGPQIGLALAGLGIMGGLLVAIGEFAVISIVAFSIAMEKAKITPEKTKFIVETLESFVDMAVKLSAAIALLSLSAPFAAIGGIASKLFGAKNPFDSLTEVLELISDAFLQTLETLDKMTGDPALLKAKAEIFKTISSGLSDLIVPITEVMNKLSGGLFSSLNLDVVEAAGDAIVDIISVLAEPKTGVIPSIMDQLVEMATNTNIQPEKLKTMAEVFTAVTSGLASILSAVSDMIEKFSVSGGSDLGSFILQGASLGAKFVLITKVTKELLPALRNAVVSIVADIAKVAENITNIEGMKAVAPIIGAVSSALSGMLTAISSLMQPGGVSGAIDSLSNLISGRSAASLSDERLNQVQTFVAVVTGSVKRFITDLIEKIKDLIDFVPKDEMKLKGFQAVTELIKNVVSMFGPFLSAISSIIDVSTRNVRTIPGLNAMATFVRDLISQLTTAMTQLIDKLPPLIEQIMKIDIKPGLNAKVNSLKGVFEIVSSVANLVSLLRTSGGGSGGTRALNPFYEVFQPVMTILEHMFVIPFHSNRLKAVINNLSGREFSKLENIGGRVRSIKSIFEMVKSVAEATKAITDIGGGSVDPNIAGKVSNTLTNMNSVFNALLAPVSETTTNPLVDTTLSDKMRLINENLRHLEPRIKGIAQRIENLSTATESLNRIRFVGAEHISAMVRSFNEFSVELSHLDTASGNTNPINVALTRLGTSLQGARVATIRNAAVQAQINVQVRMDVGDVVAALHTQSSQRTQTNANLSRPALTTRSFIPVGARTA